LKENPFPKPAQYHSIWIDKEGFKFDYKKKQNRKTAIAKNETTI
jgi:hypothetical protein